ncbi:hypothetical protein V6N13_036021 [Hibiscus sabdariffa]|uniref:Uncharacterized protein n=1 Tax=Hibiscus sabdariffa TaxID=183260 RepID=A0ABR2S7Y0_9ROSI
MTQIVTVLPTSDTRYKRSNNLVRQDGNWYMDLKVLQLFEQQRNLVHLRLMFSGRKRKYRFISETYKSNSKNTCYSDHEASIVQDTLTSAIDSSLGERMIWTIAAATHMFLVFWPNKQSGKSCASRQ